MDYYKCECLDELFTLNSSIKNDGKYWLLTIKEFESLLMIYMDNPVVFDKIISDKYYDETHRSLDGRDIVKYIERYNVKNQSYIQKYGINNQFEKIVNLCK